MTLRINALGHVMSEHAGIWTTLPPKKARSVLFAMNRRALIGLIQIAAIIGTFIPTQLYV
jgi:hypothetical protein